MGWVQDSDGFWLANVFLFRWWSFNSQIMGTFITIRWFPGWHFEVGVWFAIYAHAHYYTSDFYLNTCKRYGSPSTMTAVR